jgi:hypothetical protein
MFEVIWLYDGVVIWIVWIEFHITTAESSHCTNMSLDIEEIRNIIVGLSGGGIVGWGGGSVLPRLRVKCFPRTIAR